jgi:hypothetical protein
VDRVAQQHDGAAVVEHLEARDQAADRVDRRLAGPGAVAADRPGVGVAAVGDQAHGPAGQQGAGGELEGDGRAVPDDDLAHGGAGVGGLERHRRVGAVEGGRSAEPDGPAREVVHQVLGVAAVGRHPGDEVVRHLVPGGAVVHVARADAGDPDALDGEGVPDGREVGDAADAARVADLQQVGAVDPGRAQLLDGAIDQRAALLGVLDAARGAEDVVEGDDAALVVHVLHGRFGGPPVGGGPGQQVDVLAEGVEVPLVQEADLVAHEVLHVVGQAVGEALLGALEVQPGGPHRPPQVVEVPGEGRALAAPHQDGHHLGVPVEQLDPEVGLDQRAEVRLEAGPLVRGGVEVDVEGRGVGAAGVVVGPGDDEVDGLVVGELPAVAGLGRAQREAQPQLLVVGVGDRAQGDADAQLAEQAAEVQARVDVEAQARAGPRRAGLGDAVQAQAVAPALRRLGADLHRPLVEGGGQGAPVGVEGQPGGPALELGAEGARLEVVAGQVEDRVAAEAEVVLGPPQPVDPQALGFAAVPGHGPRAFGEGAVQVQLHARRGAFDQLDAAVAPDAPARGRHRRRAGPGPGGEDGVEAAPAADADPADGPEVRREAGGGAVRRERAVGVAQGEAEGGRCGAVRHELHRVAARPVGGPRGALRAIARVAPEGGGREEDGVDLPHVGLSSPSLPRPAPPGKPGPGPRAARRGRGGAVVGAPPGTPQ